MNLPQTADNMQALAVDHFNQQDITDTQRHQVGQQIGLPTEIMPNNRGISYYQRMPIEERRYRGTMAVGDTTDDDRGRRHYSGRLSTQGGQATTLTALSQSNDQQRTMQPGPRTSNTAVAGGGQSAGISRKRAKKHLRKNLASDIVSPLTKAASSGVLEQLARGEATAATDTIYEAEEEADEYPNSQAVAIMAIKCEKQRMVDNN